MSKLDYAALIRRPIAGSSRSPLRMVVSAPLFTVGYIFLLIGLARLAATALGWSANLFLVGLGALHLALGIIVATAATTPAEAVGEAPFTGPETQDMALERADTLIMNRPPTHDGAAVLPPPAFPPRTRVSS